MLFCSFNRIDIEQIGEVSYLIRFFWPTLPSQASQPAGKQGRQSLQLTSTSGELNNLNKDLKFCSPQLERDHADTSISCPTFQVPEPRYVYCCKEDQKHKSPRTCLCLHRCYSPPPPLELSLCGGGLVSKLQGPRHPCFILSILQVTVEVYHLLQGSGLIYLKMKVRWNEVQYMFYYCQFKDTELNQYV